MRKCEKEMRAAVLAGESGIFGGNTTVSRDGATYTVSLHGNPIAKGTVGNLPDKFTLAGWDTTTTRSRLAALDIFVCRKRGVPHYNGEEIPDTGWLRVIR